jgi:hypothetical protein
MPHKIVWILVIAAGVFFGVLGYEKYTQYRVSRALQIELEQLQATNDKRIRQLEAQRERRRRADDYRNTACAINEDAQTCVCIHEKTGARISIAYGDCVKRAREITW